MTIEEYRQLMNILLAWKMDVVPVQKVLNYVEELMKNSEETLL